MDHLRLESTVLLSYPRTESTKKLSRCCSFRRTISDTTKIEAINMLLTLSHHRWNKLWNPGQLHLVYFVSTPNF